MDTRPHIKQLKLLSIVVIIVLKIDNTSELHADIINNMMKTGDELKKKITRKDIAEKVGVSVSVVSRALNNSGYVKKEIKDQIIRIAEEFHYVPNPYAMSLQKNQVRQILFYCKDLHNAFNIDMYMGMMQEASQRGYMALLNGSFTFSQLRTAMIDGIILQNEDSAVVFDQNCGKNYYLPVVMAGFGKRLQTKRRIPIVEWDTYEGMRLAFDYLREHGHEKIIFAGPYAYDSDNSRIVAFRSIMNEYLGSAARDYYMGICHQEIQDNEKLAELLADYADTQFQYEEEFFMKGLVTAELLADHKTDATAVICFNDELAFGLMQGLQRRQIRVPEDISIISFDGSYRRTYVYPELTCVTEEPKYHGQLLAKTLIDIIEGYKTHNVVRIPSRILEGGTVKNRKDKCQ